jgi:type I restriction enzyme S subunit
MGFLKKHKFSELYKMSSGISSKPEQAGHGYPFASFGTVFNNFFLPTNLPDLMNSSEKEQEVYSIKKGDIFLTRTSETLNELGMSSVALKDYPNATFSGFVKRLRPICENTVCEKFMGFYLRSKFFRKTMSNNAIMTLRASLNEEIFSYLNLYLPDYETQKKIGTLLISLNQKIELNNHINAELEAMAKTIYDYWFVQFDFPDQNGKPYKANGGKMVWNQELKREIPEGWESIMIGNCLSKESSIKKIPTSEILEEGNFPVIDQSTDFIAGFTNDTDAIIKTDEPRIIFGDHTRILKLINFDFARGADGTQVMLSNNIRMPQHLFYNTLLKIDLSNYGYARHYKFLKDISIILPEELISRRFETIVSPTYKMIGENIFQNQKLAELRDWLLPMLMNGQVKVKEVKEYIQSPNNLSMAAEPEVGYEKIEGKLLESR